MIIFLIIDFSLLTYCGFLIFNHFFKSNNKVLLLGASMITGPLGFLFVLSILSYIFKGSFFIILIFLGYVISCVILFLKPRRLSMLWHSLLTIRIQKKLLWQNRWTVIPLLIYVSFIFLYASGFDIGADGNIYWGIATSFTRGNYPTVLPWQPNYLTVYHEGTFVVEGALRALAPVGIATIHNFFGAFLISAILIFTTGIMREKTKSIFCLVPAVFGVFLFGGPVLLINNFQNFIQSIFNSLRMFQPVSFISNLVQFPGYENFRGGNGSGVSDISGLLYSNFYTFGLASFILFVFLFFLQSQKKIILKNFLILIIISILSASIDESFFLIEIVLFAFLYIYQIRKERFKKIMFNTVLLAFFSLIFFLLIQNPIRDSLLTPSPELPRFKLLIESDNPLFQKFVYKKGEHVLWNGKDIKMTASSLSKASLDYLGQKRLDLNNTGWLILDFKTLAFVLLVLALLLRLNLGLFFIASAILSSLFSMFLVNTFWIPNNLRLANQASQLLMFGLGVVVVELAIKKRNIFLSSFLIIIGILLLPQFLTSHAKLIKLAIAGNHSYFMQNQIDPFFVKLEKIIPDQSRIVFLDSYPSDATSSYFNLSASTRYGLFVPFSSLTPKVIGPEIGMEWYDTVNSLSPYAFKVLNIDYVALDATALKRFSSSKIQKLNNELYFKKINTTGGVTIYKVVPAFSELTDDEMNLKKMISLIDKGKTVYLDKLKLSELRGIFLVQLSKNTHLIGPAFAHTNEFMYLETLIPFQDACPNIPCSLAELRSIKNLDYAIMSPDNNPNLLFNDQFEKIASVTNVNLWKKIQSK